MKNTLTLLIASTALSATLGLPAWSAERGPSKFFSAVSSYVQRAASVFLIGDDDDGGRNSRRAGRHNGGDDDGEEGCNRSANGRCTGGNNPAQAGTVAPPKNGLITNGTMPKVQVK